MNSYVGIAAGGALGAVLRHALVVATGTTIAGRGFPTGHFTVNVIGSFAIGVLAFVLTSRGFAPEWRLFLVSGLLGSFTTFSAFSFDTVMLVENGDWPRALVYVVATVLTCVIGCWLGTLAGRALS